MSGGSATMDRASPRDRDPRGLAESLEWALITPVLMLTIFTLIEGAILLHGRSTVQQAAMAGAEAQAAMGAAPGVAETVATQVATSGDLVDVQVSSSSSGGFITVTVKARARTVVSGGLSWVTSSATVPREEP